MRKLLLLLILLPTIVSGQTKEAELNERLDYFKLHPIFVAQLTLDKELEKKLSNKEITAAKRNIKITNKNLRTAFSTFWDLNDTIIFVPDTELIKKKEEFKGGIFFELAKIGEYKNKAGQVVSIMAFKLSRPDKTDYFKNVVSRPSIDSSLVNIITEIRQLKVNVITGDVVNKRDLGRKLILINKDDKTNKLGESYVNLVRSKYKGSIMEVDNKFVIDVIMRKDPKFIYIKNDATFNAEDGTMIPLY